MAKTVQIDVDINTKDGVKSIGDLNKSMGQTLETLGEMREASSLLENELENVKVGTKEYEKLRKELIKVNTEIKNQELAMEALDNEQVASEVKSVTGGLADMAGGFALVGVSSKSMEEVVKTMAQVEGATKIATGAMEGYSSLMKLSGTISIAFGKATAWLGKQQILMAIKTKLVTAATWLWNAAISANPISLIVIGIAALIAGIVALAVNIKKVIAWFGNWKNVILALLGPIGLAIKAYQLLTGTAEEDAKKSKANNAIILAGLEARIAGINKLIDAERKAEEARQKTFSDEIARLESKGELTEEFQRKALKSQFKSSVDIAILEKEKTKKIVKEYNIKNNTAFKSDEAILASLKKRHASADLLDKARLNVDIALLEARKKNEEKALDDGKAARNELDQFETNIEKDKATKWKARNDKRLADIKAFNKRIADAQSELDDLENNAISDKTEKEIRLLQSKFDKRMLTLDTNIPQEQALILAYEQKLVKDIEAIEKKALDDKIKKADEDLQKLRDSDIRLQELKLELMEGLVIAETASAEEIASNKIKIEDKSFNIEKQKLQAQLDDKELSQKEFNAKMSILEQEHQNNINSIQSDATDNAITTMGDKVSAWQIKNAEKIAVIQESFQVAMSAMSGIMDAVSQVAEQRAEKDKQVRESEFEAETEGLKAQLANRELSQKEFDAKMRLLEQKKEQEERKAARKAFERNKKMQLATAIMNTAQAILSGLSAPFPLGIVMAAVNTALAATQIGIIASSKFKAAKGAVVPGSPSGIDSVDALLAPGEAVINSNSASMFPELLSEINMAGGGASLTPSTPTSNVSATQNNNVFAENDKQSTVKAIVVESDITDVQEKVSRIERRNSFG